MFFVVKYQTEEAVAMTENRQTYDTPWKQIIEFFFPQFMDFFVPGSTEDIDWNVKIKFLDKEFQKITRESATGRRHTDKLVEVTLKNRAKKWILIHIEVQSRKNSDFSERMFVYNYRIYDRYKIPVTSVAILSDNAPSWNPAPFRYGLWGSTMGLEYIKTKLLDYKDKWLYLETSDNPFAIVVMAHLKALETRKNSSLRKQWKTELTKLLYQKGYSREGVLNLYAFIDWVLTLPDPLEKIFLEDIKEFEKEEKMPYVTSAERLGRKEGKKEGREEGTYNTCVNLIRNMKKNNLNEQEIARLTDLDIEMVRKIINREPVEIPLHLLSRDE
jgi:predicted transposase/invertase (TIGR01784 family)